MATTSDNTIKKTGRRIQYPVLADGNGDFNQGDFLYFDSSAHAVKAATTDANCQYLVGVAGQANPVDPQIYGSATYLAPGTVTAEFSCVASLKTTAGETYYHGTEVSIGADSQTVTTVAGTYPVGLVWLENTTSAVTGASGVKVNVLVYNRHLIAGKLL